MVNLETQAFNIPQQTREEFTFCGKKPEQLDLWAQSLIKTNLHEYGYALRQALSETNELKVAPYGRYRLLEKIRPGVHFIRTTLAQYYNKHALALPPQLCALRELLQELEQQLILGYKIVVAHALLKKSWEPGAVTDKAILYSCHRLIAESGWLFLNDWQYYAPAPSAAWSDIHQFYGIARNKGFLDKLVQDGANTFVKELSIQQAYLRVLLLACAQPFQIRQADSWYLYQALELWTPFAILSSVAIGSLFKINLNEDAPPSYISQEADLSDAQIIYIKLGQLAGYLEHSHKNIALNKAETYSSENANWYHKDFYVPDFINDSLIHHLLNCWRATPKRGFSRMPVQTALNVGFGLSAIHHFLSGVSFNTFLSGMKRSFLQEDDANIFLDPRQKTASDDVWAAVYDTKNSVAASGAQALEKYLVDVDDTSGHYAQFSCYATNISASGYCLIWHENPPAQLQSGELIALQEASAQEWNIGVIRWIKHVAAKSLQVGVQLLSPVAEACSVQLMQKEGHSNAMRALLLPSFPAMQLPETLVVSSLSFHVGDLALLQYKQQYYKVRLLELVAITANFSQYSFKWLGTNV